MNGTINDYLKLLQNYGIKLSDSQEKILNGYENINDKLLFLFEILIQNKATRHFEYNLDLKTMNLNCKQDQLRLNQSFKLIDLLNKCNLESLSDLFNLSFQKLLTLLIDNNIIQNFFEIILIFEPELKPDFNYITNSDAINIIKDFFSLNPSLMQLLNPSLSGADSLMTDMMSQISDYGKNNITPNS